jgi:hypothetical protein
MLLSPVALLPLDPWRPVWQEVALSASGYRLPGFGIVLMLLFWLSAPGRSARHEESAYFTCKVKICSFFPIHSHSGIGKGLLPREMQLYLVRVQEAALRFCYACIYSPGSLGNGLVPVGRTWPWP